MCRGIGLSADRCEGFCRLEVDLQGKLAEAPFVVRAIVVADASLGRSDGYRRAIADVGNIVEALLDIEIVMVEKIEAFRTELQIDLLVNGEDEDLADSCIEGPCARSAEAVAGDHG